MRACGSQASTAATSAQRSACSLAHSCAAGVPARTHSSARVASQPAASAGKKGSCGGFTSATAPPCARWCATRAGSSSDHRGAVGWASSSSISAPSGQPPPGSSASSAAWPLATTATAPACKASACHTPASAGTAFGRARGDAEGARAREDMGQGQKNGR